MLLVVCSACIGPTMVDGGVSPPDGGAEETDAGAPLDAGLPRGVFELAGTDFGLPTTDLEPLGRLVGERSLVLLGESFHTSGGYSASRARVIRYLVEHKGFRVVSFEGPWLNAEKTRRYVENGEGTISAAMAGLSFYPWRNFETRALIEWLREFNVAHPTDKVRFFGADSQQGDADAIALRSFLDQSGSRGQALKEETRLCAQAKLDTVDLWYKDEEELAFTRGTQPFPVERHERCLAAISAIEAFIRDNRAALMSMGDETIRLAEISLVTLRYNQLSIYLMGRSWIAAYEHRDHGWALAFQMLLALRAPGAKAVMWAHNGHIARKSVELRSSYADQQWYYWKNAGTWLEELGSPPFSIGLNAYRIGQHFIGAPTTQPPRDDPNGVELPLQRLGPSMLLVDYKDNGVFEPGAEYTWEAQTGVDLGVPARHFDALIFLRDSPGQRDDLF